MPPKEKLIQELETASDEVISEALNFVQFLKAKPNSDISSQNLAKKPISIGQSLLKHLKTIGTWEGDDFEECLQTTQSKQS